MLKNILYSFILLPFITNAQSTSLKKCFGGTNADVAFHSVKTSNGHIALAGYSSSSNGDTPINYGGTDFTFLIIDTSGTVISTKNYGSSGSDAAYSLTECRDNGFAIIGVSDKADSNVTLNKGQFDIWIVKTDAQGNLLWEKSFGGSSSEHGYGILQTRDNGFLLAGKTNSSDGDVTSNHGASDGWLIKTDSIGNLLWEKTYGGTLSDGFYSITLCSNNDILVCGHSASSNGNLTFNNGAEDLWVMRLDSVGTVLWSKSFGGTQYEGGESIVETSSGDIVVIGATDSNNGDVTGSHGLTDSWLIKLNATGNLKWKKCFGGTLFDYSSSIIETEDKKYLFCGQARSNNGDLNGNSIFGLEDYWVVKTDTNGAIIWQKNYGGTGPDYANSIISLGDDKYVVVGNTTSNNNDVSGNHSADNDAWVLIVKDQANTTSINSYSAKTKVYYTAYPNPANTTFYLDLQSAFSSELSLILYNNLGERVIVKDKVIAGDRLVIDVSHIPAGIYYLEINDTNNTGISRIIVQK